MKACLNQDFKVCEKCMEGAPYAFCCQLECGILGLCADCAWKKRIDAPEEEEDD